jgi:hypothetical protein
MGFTKTCSKTDDYSEGETQIIIENKSMILSHHDIEYHHQDETDGEADGAEV